MRYTHRIRKCTGNTKAWCLVRLNDDGTEVDSYGSYTTAMTIDSLLARAGHLKPKPGDVVQVILD